jgi:hypothetical protein
MAMCGAKTAGGSCTMSMGHPAKEHSAAKPKKVARKGAMK